MVTRENVIDYFNVTNGVLIKTCNCSNKKWVSLIQVMWNNIQVKEICYSCSNCQTIWQGIVFHFEFFMGFVLSNVLKHLHYWHYITPNTWTMKATFKGWQCLLLACPTSNPIYCSPFLSFMLFIPNDQHIFLHFSSFSSYFVWTWFSSTSRVFHFILLFLIIELTIEC